MSGPYRELFVDAEAAIAKARREEEEAEARRRLVAHQQLAANASANAFRKRQESLVALLREVADDYESRVAAYKHICTVYPKAFTLGFSDLLRDL